MDWYRSKRAIVARLDGVVEGLASAVVSPDAISLSAVPVAVAGGLVFAALHPVAAGIGRPLWLLAAVYLAGWSFFYMAYRRIRDPRRAR
jgi:hypothetical protein